MTESKSGEQQKVTESITMSDIQEQTERYGAWEKEIIDNKGMSHNVRVVRGWYNNDKLPGKPHMILGEEPNPESGQPMRVTYIDTLK